MFNNERCMDMGEMKNMEMKKEHHMNDGKMGMNMSMMDECCLCPPRSGMVCPPVMECPQERCVHREIIHEVPQVI